MAAVLQVNVEALVVGLLLGSDVAGLVAVGPQGEPEIGTELRADQSYPAVQVIRTGGRQGIRRPAWLDVARIQVDAWAESKLEAHDVVAMVRAVLLADETLGLHELGDYGAGVITDVVEQIAPQWLPDTSAGLARPRYLYVANVAVHPAA